MPKSKIQDEAEVIRWFQEGRTYQWMCDEYERKYNIIMVPSAFGNFRRRRGLDRRLVRNDDLIPWEVKVEHRWAYPLAMLRTEARQRAGSKLTPSDEKRLATWKANMEERDVVVHYDPETEEGFFYVPRRPGVDTDMIRQPDHKTTQRRAAD